MPIQQNPHFHPPKNKNIKVWRFMDLAKYMFLINSKSLFFSRSDLLDDPYEGSLAHINTKTQVARYKDTIPQYALEELSSVRKAVRRWTYINCWYMNEHESNAMWMTATTKQSIAIQSTYADLHKYLALANLNICLGVVNYVDYKTHFMPENNLLAPFIYKRHEFEYEKEIRAIIKELPTKIDGKIQYGMPNDKKGISVSIPLNTLVKTVHIHPKAERWFIELTENVTRKYGYKFSVRQSSMSAPPSF